MSLINADRQNLHAVSTAFTPLYVHRYGNNPLIKGEYAPKFTLQKKVISGGNLKQLVSTEFTITLDDILQYRQPLVILFYNTHNENISHLKTLISFSRDVHIMGGRLLILTSSLYFKKLHLQESDISIFYDEGNLIAGAFGLYNAEKPLWQWVSGIENEVPVPAAYVIAPDGKIIFDYADYAFKLFEDVSLNNVFVRTVLTTVYHTDQEYINKSIKYKSVS